MKCTAIALRGKALVWSNKTGLTLRKCEISSMGLLRRFTALFFLKSPHLFSDHIYMYMIYLIKTVKAL